MPRQHTLTHAELTELFPGGIPVSVIMIADRSELVPTARNALIRQIAEEQNPSPASCSRAANTAAHTAAKAARRQAFTEALALVKEVWEKSPWSMGKTQYANALRKRLAALKTSEPPEKV